MSKIYQYQPLKLRVKAIDEEGETLTTIGATTTNLHVRKPDDSETTWVGTIDPVDATRVSYDCLENTDLDQIGWYSVQAIIDDASGNGPWPGDSAQFEVKPAHT